MSKITRLSCYGLLFCLAALPVFAQQNRPFNWSLGLQNVRTGDLVSFSAPVVTSTGERFRLIINPGSGCYAYVIYESPNGEDVSVLHSGPLKSGEAWYSPVLELTNPQGAESFFVVASLNEQRALAQRISALSNSSSATQRRALMNEVFSLRREVSRFKEAPEKPVLMGGAARGNPDKSQGMEFSGLDTYVKTISIQH